MQWIKKTIAVVSIILAVILLKQLDFQPSEEKFENWYRDLITPTFATVKVNLTELEAQARGQILLRQMNRTADLKLRDTFQSRIPFRRKVLLIGDLSLISKIFNENDRVAYLHEPLFMLDAFESQSIFAKNSSSLEKKNQLKTDILVDYLENCNLPSLEKYVLNQKNLNVSHSDFFNSNFHQYCQNLDTCHLEKSKLLVEIFKNKKQVISASKFNFKRVCLNKNMTVAGISRLDDIKNVMAPINGLFKHLFLIFVVAEPKRVETCWQIQEYLTYLDSDGGSWLRNNVLFVRQETLRNYPKFTTKKIYKFLSCKNNCGLQHLNLSQILDNSSQKLTYIPDSSYETDQKFQEICGTDFYSTFGYKIYQDPSDVRKSRTRVLKNWRFAILDGRYVSQRVHLNA